MAVNSIGTFTFQNLRGQPEYPANSSQELRRANVEAVDVKILAEQGRTFVLTSAVSVENLAAGLALYKQYLALIAQNPVTLIWMDHNFAAEAPTAYTTKVRNVTRRLLEARENIQPQITAPPPTHKAWLECDWTLLNVKVITP